MVLGLGSIRKIVLASVTLIPLCASVSSELVLEPLNDLIFVVRHVLQLYYEVVPQRYLVF